MARSRSLCDAIEAFAIREDSNCLTLSKEVDRTGVVTQSFYIRGITPRSHLCLISACRLEILYPSGILCERTYNSPISSIALLVANHPSLLTTLRLPFEEGCIRSNTIRNYLEIQWSITYHTLDAEVIHSSRLLTTATTIVTP